MAYGIVAIGFNRALELKRLLENLNGADYKGDSIILIISIDGGKHCKDVYSVAEEFQWKHGQCICRFHKKKLGLKEHVLKCGTYLEEYNLDALAVFEDDIYPSPAFYNYMKQAIEYYESNEQIAGISLYTHLWNVEAQLPFQPDFSGYDTFFIQYAQSWGQIWTRKQWKEFMNWYAVYQGKINDVQGVPESVRNWPESSWLKYHIAYCVSADKYFVYPYESLSTCFSEAGTHTKEKTDIFQVPLMCNSRKIYQFQPVKQKSVSYDVYFEREQIGKWLGMDTEELIIDLWGKRKNIKGSSRQFILTSKRYPWYVVASYGLSMRPHEVNIREKVPGNDLILYDMKNKNKGKIKSNRIDIVRYYFRLYRGIIWYAKHLGWLVSRKILY